MANRGYCHRRSLQFAVPGGELFDGTESTAAEFPGNAVRPRRVCVDNSHQADGLALLGQLVINAGVIASEGAHANHGHVNEVVSAQISVPAKLKPI